MLLPEQLAGCDVDRVEVVGDSRYDGDLFGTVRSVDPADDQRREKRVHLARFVIKLELPKQLGVLDVLFGEESDPAMLSARGFFTTPTPGNVSHSYSVVAAVTPTISCRKKRARPLALTFSPRSDQYRLFPNGA